MDHWTIFSVVGWKLMVFKYREFIDPKLVNRRKFLDETKLVFIMLSEFKLSPGSLVLSNLTNHFVIQSRGRLARSSPPLRPLPAFFSKV